MHPKSNQIVNNHNNRKDLRVIIKKCLERTNWDIENSNIIKMMILTAKIYPETFDLINNYLQKIFQQKFNKLKEYIKDDESIKKLLPGITTNYLTTDIITTIMRIKLLENLIEEI
ncbi:MAG: hypothetical protein RCG15_01660 [Candidatus Rickettsia vulgarisii]